VTAARAVFEEECRKHAAAEADRQRQLGAYPAEFKHWCEKVEADVAAHNAQVDKFAADLSRAEPNAVVEYFGLVLGNSVYPDDFPQHYRLAYVPESRQLVVEYNPPTLDVIPAVREHRYVKARDEIRSSAPPCKGNS